MKATDSSGEDDSDDEDTNGPVEVRTDIRLKTGLMQNFATHFHRIFSFISAIGRKVCRLVTCSPSRKVESIPKSSKLGIQYSKLPQ
jgi:hypothetical protein